VNSAKSFVASWAKKILHGLEFEMTHELKSTLQNYTRGPIKRLYGIIYIIS
jgi:hypothetical protein